MASKHVGHAWFTGRSQIAVVLCVDAVTKKQKAYIHTVVGMDEEDDIQHVMEYGMKFPVEAAALVIDQQGTWTDKPLWLRVTGKLEYRPEGQ